MRLKAIGLILMPAFLVSGSANAETMYPDECCPQLCSTLEDGDRVVSTGEGTFAVTRKFGRVRVPASLPYRESSDGLRHICIGTTDIAPPVVKCIFMPPMM